MAHPSKGRQTPIKVNDKIAVQSSSQDTEYLLCESCEQRFSGWEKYVSEQARQIDGSFPASSSLRNVQQLADKERVYHLCDASALQIDVISRFAASVIWRASVSKKFDRVQLGERYSGEFRRFLLEDNLPFPSQARLVVEFIDLPTDGPQIDHVIAGPTSEIRGGHHTHMFIVSGIHFKLFVGRILLPQLEHLCFARTGRAQLSTGERVLGNIAKKALNATPKGKALISSGLLANVARRHPSST